MSETRSLDQFLDALGSSAPTPGGGAASALVGALAAALAEMVAQLTVGRPKYAAVEKRAQTVLRETQRLRNELLALVDEDARAYGGVAVAYALLKGTDDERRARDEAIQASLQAAMQPPLQIMERGCDVLRLAGEIAEIGNPTVASDAGCAALLGEAAARAAGLNVMANVALLRDEAIQASLQAAMQPPLQIMERGCDVLRLADEIAGIGNPTVASDAGCAALLGEAAVRAAGLNVMANVVLLRDEQAASRARERALALEAQAAELRERALATVRAKMKF